MTFDDGASFSKIARSLVALEQVGVRCSGSRRSRTGRHVVLLRVCPGKEAVGAEQLAAERPDPVSVDHPPPQTLGPHRQSVAPRAEER